MVCEGIKMVVEYDVEKINKALKDFYNATGSDIDLINPDFHSVCNREFKIARYCKKIQASEKGKRACVHSDMELLEKCKASKQTESHLCHAGLLNVTIPILHEDFILGYLMVGCIKPQMKFSDVQNYLSDLGLETGTLKKYYNEIPFYEADKIRSISNVATMFVKYILLENMLKIKNDDAIYRAVCFINENLEKDLSIKTISQNINVSKSVLYNKFHSRFHCTVSEYIKEKRINKSIEFLIKTDLSMEEISQKVGFSSASYYTKIFKKQMRITPVKYKKAFLKHQPSNPQSWGQSGTLV